MEIGGQNCRNFHWYPMFFTVFFVCLFIHQQNRVTIHEKIPAENTRKLTIGTGLPVAFKRTLSQSQTTHVRWKR